MSGKSPYQMTPEELENTPAAKPPDGVQFDLKNPHSDGPVLIIVAACLLALVFLFAGLRFYMKGWVRRKFTPDDWTALIAIIGTCAYYALCVYAVTVQGFGTHMWNLSIAHCSSKAFAQTGFHLNWIPALVWAFAKTTFFLMYIEIFHPLVWLRWSCYFGLFVNWGFYIGKLVASIYLMAPNPGQSWQAAPSNPRYKKSFDMTIPIATGSLVLDIYILILPMIVFWNLQVSNAQRLRLFAIFGMGILACVASSLSIVFNHKVEQNVADYTYWIYPTLLMALLEMCTGIICSSMPALAGFFKSAPGKRLMTWGSSFLNVSTRYGGMSTTNSRNPKESDMVLPGIQASTYINIDTESASTHELVNVHSTFASQK